MNKIIIVGHPQSGYQEVESLLNACGMANAQPSRREGFLPEQISSTLCKVHSTAALNQLEAADQIQQIEAGPVWHGMALDLMLGNLDQPIWGWADPQSIYLLNYWRDLDPNITFILVYDRPHTVLTQANAEDVATLSPQALSQRTRQWAAYNAALLHFYHRNPQRCLLVHSQQVRESAASYLQQVRTRINAPWPESMVQLAAPESAGDEAWPIAIASATATDTQDNSNSSSLTLEARTQPLDQPEPTPQALALFVADALLRQHPASLQLYQELQAVANLPLAEGIDNVLHAQSALQAWHAMSAQRLQLQEQTRQLDHLQQTQAEAEARIVQATQEQTRLKAEQATAQQRTTQLTQQLEQLQRQLADNQTSAEENDLLLTQLHQVQEELERHYLEKQAQAKQLQALQQAQKEAEKQATERQQQLETLAAERQQQLDQLQAQHKQATEQAQIAAQAIEQAQARAARLEAQLATAKAQAAAAPKADPAQAQENELLLTQLHQVQEELERYYLENQRLKKAADAQPKAPYGAVQRLKSELPYRTGATLIEHSRSLRGLLSLPAALRRQAREYHRENPPGERAQRIPLEQYQDAGQLAPVQQHLSYRLGLAWVTHSRNPIGWVRLPFALRREVKAFRQRKKA